MSALVGTNADWYLMRASGFVLFVLFTATACLGIANLARIGRKPSVRAVATLVHRNASLLALVFLVLHVITAVSDRFVKIPLTAIVVPGVSGYDPLWTGLGAVALDLMIAVVVTSLLRSHLRYRSWQLVHWLSYLSWPTALLHSIGSGSGTGVDTGRTWSTAVYVCCGVAFAVAVAVRLNLERSNTPAPPGRPIQGRPTQGRPTAARTATTVPARRPTVAASGSARSRGSAR